MFWRCNIDPQKKSFQICKLEHRNSNFDFLNASRPQSTSATICRQFEPTNSWQQSERERESGNTATHARPACCHSESLQLAVCVCVCPPLSYRERKWTDRELGRGLTEGVCVCVSMCVCVCDRPLWNERERERERGGRKREKSTWWIYIYIYISLSFRHF